MSNNRHNKQSSSQAQQFGAGGGKLKANHMQAQSISSSTHHDRNQSDNPNLLMRHAMSNTDLQFFE